MTHTLGCDIRQDRFDPVAIYNTIQRQCLSTKREDRVRETSYAIYAENQTHWAAWLRTVAGIRGDRYDFDVDSNIADNSGSRSAGIGSPKLAVVLGPWQKTEYFVNFGEGFHSNDGRGTTTHVDPGIGEAVDPVTALVRAKGAEFGVRTEATPNLQSPLSFWYLHLDSELIFQGDTGSTPPRALPNAAASNGRITTRRTNGCCSSWTSPIRAPGLPTITWSAITFRSRCRPPLRAALGCVTWDQGRPGSSGATLAPVA